MTETPRTFDTEIDIKDVLAKMKGILMRGHNSEPARFKTLLMDAAQFVLKEELFTEPEQWELEKVAAMLDRASSQFLKMTSKRLRSQVAEAHILCFNLKLELLKC